MQQKLILSLLKNKEYLELLCIRLQTGRFYLLIMSGVIQLSSSKHLNWEKLADSPYALYGRDRRFFRSIYSPTVKLLALPSSIHNLCCTGLSER